MSQLYVSGLVLLLDCIREDIILLETLFTLLMLQEEMMKLQRKNLIEIVENQTLVVEFI